MIMQKILITLTIILAAFIIVPSISLAENVYVSVRETQLRPKADFLSKGTFLKYGDMLNVIKDQDNWLNVKTAVGKQGFVHRSAITERRVVLKGQSSFMSSGSSQSDIVLAGKGFSKEVENQFALQNRSLNFRAVDTMEKPRVAPNDLSMFVTAGKLNGGAQ